jgi:hypothetical protein
LLEKELGRPVVVQDLSKSGAGADADYLLLRERLKRSSVRLVVMEYRSIPQRINHYHFIQAAEWGDLFLNACVLDCSLSVLASTVREKLAVFMTQMAAGRWFVPPAHVSAAATYDETTPPDGTVDAVQQAAAAGRKRERKLPIGEPVNVLQDAYVRKTMELVRSQGGELILMTVPNLKTRALPPSERERLAHHFGTDVVTMSESELARLEPRHYSDPNHHGWLALDIYMPMVAQWIAPRLAKRQTVEMAP